MGILIHMKRKIFSPSVTVVRRTDVLRVPRKRIEELVTFLSREEDATMSDVEIAIVADREMSALNRTYHHVRGTTDVLSFNLAGRGEPICAQIIVCADEAIRQAKRRRLKPQRELLLYITHGLLHLLGYDDTTKTKAERMSGRQEKILSDFFARKK